jgi:hypothetical protein
VRGWGRGTKVGADFQNAVIVVAVATLRRGEGGVPVQGVDLLGDVAGRLRGVDAARVLLEALVELEEGVVDGFGGEAFVVGGVGGEPGAGGGEGLREETRLGGEEGLLEVHDGWRRGHCGCVGGCVVCGRGWCLGLEVWDG